MLSSLYKQAQSKNCDICICDYYEVYGNKKVYTKAINKISDNNKINYMLSNPSPWNKLIKAKDIHDLIPDALNSDILHFVSNLKNKKILLLSIIDKAVFCLFFLIS